MSFTVSDVNGTFAGGGAFQVEQTPTGPRVTFGFHGSQTPAFYGGLAGEMTLDMATCASLASGALTTLADGSVSYPVPGPGESPSGGNISRRIRQARMVMNRDMSVDVTIDYGPVIFRGGSPRETNADTATLHMHGQLGVGCSIIREQSDVSTWDSITDLRFQSEFCRNTLRAYGLADVAAFVGHPLNP